MENDAYHEWQTAGTTQCGCRELRDSRETKCEICSHPEKRVTRFVCGKCGERFGHHYAVDPISEAMRKAGVPETCSQT